jgi:membrane-bound serine protease (ClpP class)
MVTEIARVVEDLAPEGKVFLKGEVWDAVAASPVRKGEKVRVVSVEGLLLHVVPVEGTPTVKEE